MTEAAPRTKRHIWLAGARPRTLPAAVAPVLVGTSVAFTQGDVIWWRAVAALVVSLAVQVGTNYANDYSDGVRGTDDGRVGPLRLTATGLASPGAVKRAAFLSFGVAGVAGLALAIVVSPWLVLVGAACFAAGWFYTGGSHPYGYLGFGELSVFVFFGLVAVVGSAFVHLHQITLLAVAAAIPVGLLATALLVVNNLRDIATDTVSGKRTLAVHLGDAGTRVLYIGCLVAAFVAVVPISVSRFGALLAMLALALAVRPIHAVDSGATGRSLVDVLQETGRLQLAFAVLLALGIAL